MITITEYFEADHKRLDLLLMQCRDTLVNDIEKAKSLFEAFASGLKTHIYWEETILFPFFENKTRFSHGPTKVMMLEHQQILSQLDLITQTFDTSYFNKQTEQLLASLEQLDNLLGSHNQKEENILYPMIDQNASPQDRSLMFVLMETGEVA